ncbi:MAG: cation transporter [Gemmatimonadaceae bacterium]|nr:cation transporter [Gemmatimonadaceae bacterium]
MQRHDHDHAHAHAHPHDSHADEQQRRRLLLALVLTSLFLVAEVVGGIVANSLALLADAGHMFTDVAALGLSLFVAWFSRQPATPQKTYGYLRWEVLAAFINGAALLVVSAAIVWEAIARFRAPEPVADTTMLLIAVGGLIVNAVCAWLLHGLHQHSMNTRGAYLHVLGDLLGSVGTVAAALIIRWTGWLAADPLASVIVTLLVVRSAWRLVHESVDVLLESTPSHISLGAVRARLEALPGVTSVHDLHVWTVTSGTIAMSAHAIIPEPAQHQEFLEQSVAAMREFGIGHVTVQIEREEICREAHA